MDENTLNKLVKLSLILTAISDLIGLFAESQIQILEAKESIEKSHSEDQMKQEIKELRQEIALLKKS